MIGDSNDATLWRAPEPAQPKTFSEALAQQRPQRPQRWLCLPCIAEHKAAAQVVGAPEPDVREAVTMLNGAPHCYEHITVQRNTGLVVPQ